MKDADADRKDCGSLSKSNKAMGKRYSSHYIRTLSSLYIATFFIRTSFGIMLATLPLYVGIKEGEYTGYGIVMAASPLFELGTVLAIGAIVDRHGRKKVLLCGLLVGAVFLFLLAFTKDLYVIFAINACHGIAAGAILVSSLALLTDCAPTDRRGREMGAFDAVNLLGWITGYALGALFLEILKGELHIGFIAAGIMALFGFVYSFVNIDEEASRTSLSSSIRFSNIISVLKQKSVIILTMPWFIVFMMIGAVMTFLTATTSSESDFHIPPMLLAAGIIGAGVVLISTQVFFGKLSDKYGRLPIMFIGTIGFVGLMLTLGIGYVTAPSTNSEDLKNSIIGLWPALALFGFMALAFGPSALSSLADEAHEKRRGVTMAVYSVVISAGMFIGIPAIAWVNDNYGGFGVLLFMTACAMGMLFFVMVRYIDVKARKHQCSENREGFTKI